MIPSKSTGVSGEELRITIHFILALLAAWTPKGAFSTIRAS
jgi:hypothetical protein